MQSISNKKITSAMAVGFLVAVSAGVYLEFDAGQSLRKAGPPQAAASSPLAATLNPLPPPSKETRPSARQFTEPPAVLPGGEVNTPLEGGPLFKASILSRHRAEIDFNLLARLRTAGKGRLVLDLGLPEGPVAADFSRITENQDGGYSLVGVIAGEALSQVVMTVQDQALVGDISLNPRREFMILPGPPGAPHELRQINRAILPICTEEVIPPALVADEAPEDHSEASAETLMANDGSGITAGATLAATGASDPEQSGGGPGPAATTIDVMILYTQTCLTRMQSEAGMIAAMNQAVSQANLSFQNSGVSCALRLAHHALISFTPTKMSSDLLKLQRPSDGVLDVAVQLKEQYAVDDVSVWHNYLNDSAGIGFLVNSTALAKNYCFNIVDIDYAVNNRSWVHEVGHNLGMNHDVANSSSEGFRPYSYGHRFTGASTGTLFGSIMAYPPGQRVLHFSNPDINYDGVPTGTSAANNAATAVETKATVAAARSPLALSITQQPQGRTITAGQSAPLSITATGTAPAYQWLSGAAPGSLTPVPDAAAPSLSATPAATTYYQCVLQNGAGTLYSDVVRIQVN